MHLKILLFCGLLLTQLFFVSCRDEEEDQIPEDTGGTVPAGMTRLYGNVRDQNNQPLSDVAMHVVYQVESPGIIHEVATPSNTVFYYIGTPLTTECNGSTPIPDGIPIQIYWDVDSDGPDSTDPQPPLCANPPECEDGPAQTVNLIQFAFNGDAVLEGPGTFYMESPLVTIGDVLSPNRFYLRVFCADGNVLWESNVLDVPQGPAEMPVEAFECDSCDGIPVIPEWGLDQSYPNPAQDNVTIPFSLESAATALITLRDLSTNGMDTLLHETRPAGSQTHTFEVGNIANGLYEYRFFASSFSDDGQLLKNQTDFEILEATLPRNWSDGSGAYRFDTAAENVILLRDEANASHGSDVLDRLAIVAIKPGYITVDTSIVLVSAESLRVDLTLIPQ